MAVPHKRLCTAQPPPGCAAEPGDGPAAAAVARRCTSEQISGMLPWRKVRPARPQPPAGSGHTYLELELPQGAAPAGAVVLEARMEGLLGGHSGLDIQ